MAVRVARYDGGSWGPGRAAELLRSEGLVPRSWGNGPAERYGRHRHQYHKVLYCASGSIVFHLADGDVELRPGDRLDVDPGTEHAATVGPQGVQCVEAARTL